MVSVPEHGVLQDDFSRARFECLQAVVALQLHKAREGLYPAGLDELTPELLHEVPIDPFTGKPLRYERRGEGFVLWSIGPDMRDSNGTAEFDPETMNVDDQFDIVHRAER